MADEEGTTYSTTANEGNNNKRIIKVVFVILLIGLGLLVILLPISYKSLHYYEMGFKKQKSTGSVSLDHVYESGLHLIGPDFEFKVFPASGQFLSLQRVKAFTADGLEVMVTAHLQYFLRNYELQDLHKKFNLDYEDVMETSAVDALKGALTTFNTREIVSKRKEIESVCYKAVRERLGGICCAPQDKCKSWKYACPVNCKNRDICEDSDKGLYVNIKYFQLDEIEIPNSVEERFLRQLTLQEESEREKLLQTAAVTRKETQSMVQKIHNTAYEIREEAEATSKLIQITSRANYTSEIETARSIGLSKLYKALGITQQSHKNSFDYLRTLRGMDNIWLTVDYQQRIIRVGGAGGS